MESLIGDGHDLDLAKIGSGGGGLNELKNYTDRNMAYFQGISASFGECTNPNIIEVQNIPLPPPPAFVPSAPESTSEGTPPNNTTTGTQPNNPTNPTGTQTNNSPTGTQPNNQNTQNNQQASSITSSSVTSSTRTSGTFATNQTGNQTGQNTGQPVNNGTSGAISQTSVYEPFEITSDGTEQYAIAPATNEYRPPVDNTGVTDPAGAKILDESVSQNNLTRTIIISLAILVLLILLFILWRIIQRRRKGNYNN